MPKPPLPSSDGTAPVAVTPVPTDVPAPARPAGVPRLPETPFDLLDQATCDFYLRSLDLLDQAGVPYLVGGAYSLAYHAGIVRHTKDLDVFVRAAHAPGVLQMYKEHGYRTALTFPHWLGKAFDPQDETTFVDVIYGSGNGLCPVDDDWFAHAVSGMVLGRPAQLVPAEEVIWTKSFICERERFDGGDVNHLIHARGRTLDWPRLVRRFKGHERMLLAHLLMYGYAYPGERDAVPAEVLREVFDRAHAEPPVPRGTDAAKVCMGTFISREQYLVDVHQRGYEDARLQPRGPMREQDVKHWTDAIGTIK
ncbi:MAG: hypothetical protein JWO31_3419 [Phycisphaerales bacterium]|nr:hypothetical protein [Phycisphaerales bacterium]